MSVFSWHHMECMSNLCNCYLLILWIESHFSSCASWVTLCLALYSRLKVVQGTGQDVEFLYNPSKWIYRVINLFKNIYPSSGAFYHVSMGQNCIMISQYMIGLYKILLPKLHGLICFYVDCHCLNAITAPDSFSVPWVLDLLELGGATCIPSLDLVKGHCTRVKSAFTTP